MSVAFVMKNGKDKCLELSLGTQDCYMVKTTADGAFKGIPGPLLEKVLVGPF